MAGFTKMYQQILSRLEGGGKTLEADLADIEAGKRTAIAGGQQALVSGGLAGTTVMGAVPLSAEKTAGRARLRARGAAESKYMTAMMSFANLAEAARQAKLGRESAMERLQVSEMGATGRARLGAQTSLQMAGQPVGGTMQAPVRTYGGTFGAASFPDMFSIPGERPIGGGDGYAQQFPSLYDQGGVAAPDWTGAGGVSGLSPAAQMFQTGIDDERRFDIDFGPGTLVGDVGGIEQRTERAVTAGLPPSAQPGGRMMTAPEYRARYGESAFAAAQAGRAKAVGTPEGNIRYTKV